MPFTFLITLCQADIRHYLRLLFDVCLFSQLNLIGLPFITDYVSLGRSYQSRKEGDVLICLIERHKVALIDSPHFINQLPVEQTLYAGYNDTRLSLSELLITDTELKLIAAAAMMGDRSSPKTG
jgi:hypothetical protein